jgi:hypothetical protein
VFQDTRDAYVWGDPSMTYRTKPVVAQLKENLSKLSDPGGRRPAGFELLHLLPYVFPVGVRHRSRHAFAEKLWRT